MENSADSPIHLSKANLRRKYNFVRECFDNSNLNCLLGNGSSNLKTEFHEALLWNESNDFLRASLNIQQAKQMIPLTAQFYAQLKIVLIPRYASLSEGKYVLDNTRRKIRTIVNNAHKNDNSLSDSNRMLDPKEFASSCSDLEKSSKQESRSLSSLKDCESPKIPLLSEKEDSLTRLLLKVEEIERLSRIRENREEPSPEHPLKLPERGGETKTVKLTTSDPKIKRKAHKFINTPNKHCNTEETEGICLDKRIMRGKGHLEFSENVKFVTPKYEAVENKDAGKPSIMFTKIKSDTSQISKKIQFSRNTESI